MNEQVVDRAVEMFNGQGSFWPAEDAARIRDEAKRTLAGRFVVPPFTVLDARQGYWRDRKRAWLALGIEGEIGRFTGVEFQPGVSMGATELTRDPNLYMKKNKAEADLCRPLSYAEFMRDHYDGVRALPQTSVFDPVMCEIATRWFCPPGGRILDPFAGGSVRGIVAAVLGRQYTGIDLRPEQVAANREQWAAIKTDSTDEPEPVWHADDSRNIPQRDDLGAPYDLVFTCPPYYDLEVYSDDPADLSRAASYEDFRAAHAYIISEAMRKLAPDRFAVWVIGNIRDKRGLTIDLMGDTVRAFEAAGARLYNEAVFITTVGTLRLRVVRSFGASRKLGKHHQQMLIFCNGDPKRAAQACGEIELLPGADVDPGGEAEAVLDERW